MIEEKQEKNGVEEKKSCGNRRTGLREFAFVLMIIAILHCLLFILTFFTFSSCSFFIFFLANNNNNFDSWDVPYRLDPNSSAWTGLERSPSPSPAYTHHTQQHGRSSGNEDHDDDEGSFTSDGDSGSGSVHVDRTVSQSHIEMQPVTDSGEVFTKQGIDSESKGPLNASGEDYSDIDNEGEEYYRKGSVRRREKQKGCM